ncbi:MAG: hypothetical protein FP814_12950 [Desulfobacterium sp.]|nr:hypothetical protein [Desulfobacterium sp.]MBU3949156.1 hypothetical protein [Pseudomonadota bacterium]MBU4010944.1 hypothetical protein [Pseudomonadota bacterium]MBU4036716.1 hypothetical protein [Pseudomonadota bacterium]
MQIPYNWGATPHELLLQFPCDRFVQKPCTPYYRGITINASAETLFPWLCQMRVAPYSYDWIDNFGRQSPQKLIQGLNNLVIGQNLMFIFELIDFEQNRHITIRLKPDTIGSRIFGDCPISYLIVPQTRNTCRLLVKLTLKYSPGLLHWLVRAFLAWGDFIMMRRQLLNFKSLSEQSQRKE